MKLIKSICIFVLLYSYASQPAVAQSRQIIPNTPEATAFTKVVNFPVNLNSGTPNISIPIWNLEIGGLSLPISLDYHAGGFRINEKSGALGLGWSLSTDIQITRTINGMDDFSGLYGYAYSDKIATQDIYTSGPVINFTNRENHALASGMRDGKPDKFSYRLLNKSGNFYVLRNGPAYSFVTAPYENIKITYDNQQFRIVDTDGSVYFFSLPILENQEPDGATVGREYVTNTLGTEKRISTWKCLRITNATGTDNIDFTYSNKTLALSSYQPDFITYYNDETQCPVNSWTTTINYPNSALIANRTTFSGVLSAVPFYSLASPKYMEYSNGQPYKFKMIWKNPATNQLEVKSYDAVDALAEGRKSVSGLKGLALSSITFRGGSIQFNGIEKLTSMKITSGQEVKTVEFHQTITAPAYLSSAQSINGTGFTGTLYLDSIRTLVNNVPYERYGFLYKRKTCFGDHLQGSDAWGYTNSKTMEIAMSNIVMVWHFPVLDFTQTYFPVNCGTPETINVKIDGYADEYPDEELMQSGMLTRIVYPTGGYVDFDYEANRYEGVYGDEMGVSRRSLFGGGLRIQKINYYDGISNKPVKQKYYTYGETENGDGQLLYPPPVQYIDGKQVYGNYKISQNVYYGYGLDEVMGTVIIEGVPTIITQPCSQNNCIQITKKETKNTFLPCSALGFDYSGGASIYYTRVNEYDLDYGRQTGKTVHNFYPVNEFNTTMASAPLMPLVRNNTDEKYLQENWFCGKLKSVESYAMKDGKFVIRHRKSYKYVPYMHQYAPGINYSYFNNLYYVNVGFNTMQNLLFEVRNGMGGMPVSTPDFNTGYGFIPIGAVRLTAEEEEFYDENNNYLKTSTAYTYTGDWMQPSTIEFTDSKNMIKRKSLKYSYNYPGDITYILMHQKNMVSQVIEEVVTNEFGQELTRTKNNYALFNNSFYAPSSVQSSVKGGNLHTDLVFEKYNSYANLLSATDRQGVRKTYVWGYSSRFPVAEVLGAKYDQVQALNLSSSILDAPASNTALFTELNKLNTLTGNLIQHTKYAYKPQAGISEAVNVNNQHTRYEYDIFNRLTTVYDNNNNILKKMEYSNLITATDAMSSRGYTNKPVMLTFCDCRLVSTVHPANNYITKGATNLGLTQSSVDSYTLTDLLSLIGNGHIDAPCLADPGNNNAALRLITNMDATPPRVKPGVIQLDLLQSGALAGSMRFGLQDNINRVAYFKEGLYQLGLGYDPFYRGRAVKYYLTSSDGLQSMYIYNGTVVEFKKGVTYTINATTFL